MKWHSDMTCWILALNDDSWFWILISSLVAILIMHVFAHFITFFCVMLWNVIDCVITKRSFTDNEGMLRGIGMLYHKRNYFDRPNESKFQGKQNEKQSDNWDIHIGCSKQFKWNLAQTYLHLPLRQWGASNVYLLVLSRWKVNIAENPIAVMGL